jgi:hypothetical protein
MAVVSYRAWVLALGGTGLLLASACGSRSTLYAFGEPRSGRTADDAGGDDLADAAEDSPVPFDAPTTEDAPACMGKPIQLAVVSPNLYFVLDHSTSMNEMNKWSNMRSVVAQLITQIGAGARMGAMMFPGSQNINSCDVGSEVMALQQGDAQGNLAATFLTATSAAPTGGTPTAATLNSLVRRLSGLAGTTFAILATDGGPNCDSSIVSCPAYRCTANIDGVGNCPADFSSNCCDMASSTPGTPLSCIDDDATIAAAQSLANAGVKTYVLGIPGSAAYGSILDEVAIAGGTARTTEPLYYEADTADDAALEAEFQQIVQQTGAGCTFTLATAPSLTVGMRVVLGGKILPSSGPNRWTLVGRTLTLFGTSCTAVKNGGAPSLQFFDGCRGS